MSRSTIPTDPEENKVPKWEDLLRRLPKRYSTLDCDGANQLVLYQKGPLVIENIQKWIEEVIRETKNRDIHLVSVCGECNQSLLVFSGSAIEEYIHSHISGGGPGNKRNGGTVAGWQDEGKGFFFSSNVKIWLPNAKLKRDDTKDRNTHDGKKSDPRKAIKVAVFDTGVMPEEITDYLLDEPNPCIPLAIQGWNFTVPNNQFKDDNPGEHGSNVTQYVINKVFKEDKAEIRVIPVKIHNSNGKSDLYSILCGLAYAANRHVNIINASFGYFAPIETEKDAKAAENYGVNLFRQFINDQLVANNIILVAAAGNEAAMEEVQSDFRNLYPLPTDVRDLDQISFYPASFARQPPLNPDLKLVDVSDFVIAVTTVLQDTGDEVSEHQNYSKNVVDVGIRADVDKIKFLNPRYTFPPLEGSSFATPKMTGLIAAYYEEYRSAPQKKNVIDTLIKIGKLRNNQNVADQIRNGVIDSDDPVTRNPQ